jgi:ABC-type phosphate/phosphonate transport system ATPase subunit
MHALENFAADKALVICALHQVDVALQWATRIVVIDNGKLVLDRLAHTVDRSTIDLALQ